jgi:hypothetical protein
MPKGEQNAAKVKKSTSARTHPKSINRAEQDWGHSANVGRPRRKGEALSTREPLLRVSPQSFWPSFQTTWLRAYRNSRITWSSPSRSSLFAMARQSSINSSNFTRRGLRTSTSDVPTATAAKERPPGPLTWVPSRSSLQGALLNRVPFGLTDLEPYPRTRNWPANSRPRPSATAASTWTLSPRTKTVPSSPITWRKGPL